MPHVLRIYAPNSALLMYCLLYTSILQPSGNVSAGFIFGGVVVLKDIFRLKHFVRYIPVSYTHLADNKENADIQEI